MLAWARMAVWEIRDIQYLLAASRNTREVKERGIRNDFYSTFLI